MTTHDKLMERVKEKISDGRILDLIEAFLKVGIFDGIKEWEPEKGTPQGGVISPLLANIYLNEFDHRMTAAGFEIVRYADDFLVMCDNAMDGGPHAQDSWVKQIADTTRSALETRHSTD